MEQFFARAVTGGTGVNGLSNFSNNFSVGTQSGEGKDFSVVSLPGISQLHSSFSQLHCFLSAFYPFAPFKATLAFGDQGFEYSQII